MFKLEQNYRSTQTIVKAANSLIEKNREQIRKEVFSENDKGEPITVFNAYSDVEEGEIVANKIAQLRTKKDIHTMNLLYCIVRMPKAVSSKRHYARGEFLTVFTEACLSISVRK